MEILSFMLGVSAVLIILGVVFMFSMYKKIKSLSDKLTTTINIQNDLFKQIDDTRNEIYQQIREENRSLSETTERIYQTIDTNVVNLERTIDSRLDKLENKLKTKSSKTIINE
jgi:methyl-accepting chemotaxis protein